MENVLLCAGHLIECPPDVVHQLSDDLGCVSLRTAGIDLLTLGLIEERVAAKELPGQNELFNYFTNRSLRF